MSSRDAVSELRQRGSDQTIGVVVCNMAAYMKQKWNVDVAYAANVVSATAPLLKDRALLVMTLRFQKQANHLGIETHVRRCIAALETSGFRDVRVRHLLTNARFERTVTARLQRSASKA
eukprot:TRINITY_DN19922_c0_g1_i2.p2 TRINITY_DN19922_c0_g1~~TRINITY_DN19922_c0_g1_i2.p2  ORF type:complete len:119 (-),score=21.22 TRINITY_DN19922_c0_g1_i2:12-368(-)